jgi:hypothetical protein
MSAMPRLLPFAFPIACCLAAVPLRGDPVKVPEPPKPDVPYLVMADDLVSTEALTAHSESHNEGKKNQESTYWIPGEHSSAKTPLASPIFAFKKKDLDLERFEVYPFTLKNGRREVTFSSKKDTVRYTLTITKVGEDLYRMEVNESLPAGEYAITPNGSDQVFCFAVF